MNRYDRTHRLAAASLLAVCAAANGADRIAALSEGRTSLDLRLRYETVTQDGALADAAALTLRTRLGYTTAPWSALEGFVEMESVAAPIDDYAPVTPGHSTIADPPGTEVNQFGLRYTGVPGLNLSLGRSRLVLDNARWVGNVAWRQNEQTFDGAFLRWGNSATGPSGQYAYLTNVHTVTGADLDLEGHLFNLGLRARPWLALTAYLYRLDFAAPGTADTVSFGLRGHGRRPLGARASLSYAVEYARQQAQTAAGDFRAGYALAEIGVGIAPVALTLGYEVLGSDHGRYGLQTPLATKHAFQGWADVFLTTPDTGIADLYAAAQGAIGPLRLTAVWHRFATAASCAQPGRHGDEFDISAGMPLAGALTGLIKAARYRAAPGSGTADTDKLWAQLEYAF